MRHCETCSCHSLAPVPDVKFGDLVRDRLTGVVGEVTTTTLPNRDWHDGGIPGVVNKDTREFLGYWYYYDLVEQGS